MKKIIIYLSLFLLSVSSVHAVTITNPTDVPGSALFNFQVIQADEGVLTTPYDSRVGSTAQITNATATSNNGITPAFAYLDGPSGGPGGLGVCKVLNAGQCSPSGDDNITVGESILLELSETILVGDIYFRNGDHGTVFEGQVSISIDNGLFMTTLALADVITSLTDQIINENIKFSFVGTDNSIKHQFYVAGFGAEVPLPAALPMMLMGLLGLFGFRKITA